MNRACHELLARPRLAADQHGQIRRGDFFEHGEDLAHAQRSTAHGPEALAGRGLDVDRVVFGLEPEDDLAGLDDRAADQVFVNLRFDAHFATEALA